MNEMTIVAIPGDKYCRVPLIKAYLCHYFVQPGNNIGKC